MGMGSGSGMIGELRRSDYKSVCEDFIEFFCCPIKNIFLLPFFLGGGEVIPCRGSRSQFKKQGYKSVVYNEGDALWFPPPPNYCGFTTPSPPPPAIDQSGMAASSVVIEVFFICLPKEGSLGTSAGFTGWLSHCSRSEHMAKST